MKYILKLVSKLSHFVQNICKIQQFYIIFVAQMQPAINHFFPNINPPLNPVQIMQRRIASLADAITYYRQYSPQFDAHQLYQRAKLIFTGFPHLNDQPAYMVATMALVYDQTRHFIWLIQMPPAIQAFVSGLPTIQARQVAIFVYLCLQRFQVTPDITPEREHIQHTQQDFLICHFCNIRRIKFIHFIRFTDFDGTRRVQEAGVYCTNWIRSIKYQLVFQDIDRLARKRGLGN